MKRSQSPFGLVFVNGCQHFPYFHLLIVVLNKMPLHVMCSEASKDFSKSSSPRCACDQNARQETVKTVASKGSSKSRLVHRHSMCWIVTLSHCFHEDIGAKREAACANIRFHEEHVR